ncbi:MAG: S4 domain-containing protein, partial [Chloroflexota bacterium]
MSIRDDFILPYFELLTDVPDSELAGFKKQLAETGFNPMTLKKRLARELVTKLYSAKEAAEAEAHFSKVVQQRETPDKMRIIELSDSNPDIRRILVSEGMVGSMSEAVRLINQGAVKINGEKLSTFNAHVQNDSIIQVGKRLFVKVVIPGT